MKDYSYSVVIGRFQPWHLEHENLVKHALNISDKVIIVIGSCNQASSIKNPFSYEERVAMISGCFEKKEIVGAHSTVTTGDLFRITFVPMRDYFYNDQLWQSELYHKVNTITKHSSSVTIVGAYKDASSYYLNLFNNWDFTPHRETGLDATAIRKLLFERPTGVLGWNPYSTNWAIDSLPSDSFLNLAARLPEHVVKWMESNYFLTAKYHQHLKEYELIRGYKEAWANAPYPPTFVTTDAVVLCLGHVLLIRRKDEPGKDLWALPGGFIKQDELLIDGAIRELKEETNLPISKTELKSQLVKSKVFDYPNRSLRGRVITHLYVFNLDEPLHGGALPLVRNSSDSAECKWVSLYDIGQYEDKMFEDHYSLLRYGVGGQE